MENRIPPSTAENASEFIPPRHWVGVEELQADYWSNPEILEKRGQEFHDKPVELLSKIDETDQSGLARREFLTLMGASMAMATTACVRRPVHKIIPYVVKPEEITPGVSNYYASTCRECSTSCGILTKNREGRPIKLEGNPDHPVNQGKLCARGQASLLNLYDTDRLKAPVQGARGGSKSDVNWQSADAAILGKLKAAGRVRVLTGSLGGDTTSKLIQEFLGSFKNSGHVEFEPLSMEEIAEAQELSYGTRVMPRYRFDRANVVLSLGADFLGTWISPLEHATEWSRTRKLDAARAAGDPNAFSKLICFEPMLTITGSSSDERYPIRPGDELKVALAIAHELIVKSKLSRFAADGEVLAALKSYEPATVARDIGVSPEVFAKAARALWQARGKSLVVAGSPQSSTGDSLALQVAVNLLNSALENEGATVDGVAAYSTTSTSYAAVAKLVQEMNAGQVDALIIHRANPLYYLPRSMGFRDAMAKVPLVLAITDREDETAKQADYVLADHHYLENWGDAAPRKGVYSLQQPAISPLHETRAFQDTLIVWAKGLGNGTSAGKAADWHAYLQQAWREGVFKQQQGSSDFELFWEGVLRDGVLVASHAGKSAVSARSFKAASLKALTTDHATSANGLSLALYPKVSLYDGRSANNAWLQEMPDPISSIAWDNYVNVAPETAKKLGLSDDDVVEITAGDVKAELPVNIQPGLHPSVVSVALGYGRKAVGKVGDLAGVDMFPFIRSVGGGRVAFSGQPVTLAKTGRFYRLARTQWHTVSENRPIINDITLAEYRKDPHAANETNPELRLESVPSLWPTHEYKGNRWGMAIDLTSCTGCGACVIGCQAENNIPVVGRDMVRVSRQMHWIKIDRYYAGTPENPELVFQPMLCQHCENAPCETVCPVLATVHDDEGLNVQVYNRCVGTRYCQNNCPYKVRRFNFFDHWKSYQGTMNLAWNPDVSVRSRGIMEKCTFCVQRIVAGKDAAKDAGERVQDGAIKTACQQTCPTDAIVFGNINDPASRVSKLRNGPRGFRVLEGLNTRPAVTYLTKVRNKEA